jgi:hypothetical protein
MRQKGRAEAKNEKKSWKNDGSKRNESLRELVPPRGKRTDFMQV